MAYIDTENIPLHMPVPGTREPAQIALLNENCVTLSTHDHTDGKALAIGRLRSGLDANRPAAGSAGNVYFSTDTGRFYVDTGTAWVQFLTEGGQGTVTGWTLIDPIIRDTLQFGPEGGAGVDATITRTGAGALRVDTHLGVGVNPLTAWAATHRTVQLGQAGAVSCSASGTASTTIGDNSYWDGTNSRAVIAGAMSQINLQSGGLLVYTAPSVAAGATQALTLRAQIAQTGTLTLTPDAGQNGIAFTTSDNIIHSPNSLEVYGGGATTLRTNTYRVSLYQSSFYPATDNVVSSGQNGFRWTSVWAATGVVSGSSADLKQAITPLDPAACAAAVLDTDWVAFEYKPPALAKDGDAEAHAKMLEETAFSRRQRGYVLGSPDHRVSDLFGLSDRMSKNNGADLAVVACALQDALRRLAALEASNGSAAAA